jgi:uncharacterized membrane protein
LGGAAFFTGFLAPGAAFFGAAFGAADFFLTALFSMNIPFFITGNPDYVHFSMILKKMQIFFRGIRKKK